MLKTASILIVTIALTGCAAKVISTNERMVMINTGSADPAGAMKLANEECAKFGRFARLNTKPMEDRQWVFDCVK